MRRNLIASLAIVSSLSGAAQASTFLIDDFEDGALSLRGDGGYPGEVYTSQSGLDPAHVIAGARLVQISPGLVYAPVLADLELSGADDALVFTSGDTGLINDAIQITWTLPSGTLPLTPNPSFANPSFVVEVDATFPAGAASSSSWNVYFETSSGVTIIGFFSGRSSSGALRYQVVALDPTDELARMSLLLTEYEPFSQAYSISEVRIITTPEPVASTLLALGGLAVCAWNLVRGRRNA